MVLLNANPIHQCKALELSSPQPETKETIKPLCALTEKQPINNGQYSVNICLEANGNTRITLNNTNNG